MLTKLTLILTIFMGMCFMFAPFFSYANTCKYQQQIERCQNTEYKKSIQDFSCISAGYQAMVYQIILDKEFQKLDNEIELYLQGLEKEKDRFLGGVEGASYASEIDTIISLFGKGELYHQKYDTVCKNMKPIVQACNNGVLDIDVFNYFHSNCNELYEYKLSIYKQVAYDTLYMNIIQVRKDNMKKYIIEERGKYSSLVDTMMVNMSYIERIIYKWTSKVRNVHK